MGNIDTPEAGMSDQRHFLVKLQLSVMEHRMRGLFRPTPPSRIPGISQPISHRFLQMVPGELTVLRVVIKHRAELEVGSRLHPLRRLELKDSLETVHA